jgi:hypothetical protein
MKRLFYIIFFVTIFSFSVNAQWGYNYGGKIQTGKTPLKIYLTNVGFVLYCAGYDANFNGQQDDGDEPPSLWVIGQDLDDNFYSNKLIDLEFRTPLLPSRSYFDLQRNVFYAINANSVDTVSLYFDGSEPVAKKGRFLSNLSNVSSISGSINKLFLSVRKLATEGFVYIYDIQKNKFVDTIKAGTNVQMNEYMLMISKLYIVNEGTFGKDDGSIQWLTYDDEGQGESGEYKIGGLPNHFLFDIHFFKLYVTCNSSNNLIRFDIEGKPDTLHLDLPQYNGPRETTEFPIDNSPDPLFAVTTYDSKVFVFNNDKEILHTFEAYGKAESLWFLGESFFIITPFEKGSYNPSSEITIYTQKETDVSDNETGEWLVSPNPVTDRFSLICPAGIQLSSGALFNVLGEKVLSLNKDELNNGTVNINLPAGTYFLNVEYNRGIKTIPVVIE